MNIQSDNKNSIGSADITATNSTRYIKIAATIALVGNALLSAMMLIAGISFSSNALVGAGLDSASDVLIGIVTLFVVGFLSKPADKKHPWGHRRAETIATAFLSFIIFFAGAQLIIESVSHLIGNEIEPVKLSSAAIVVTIISIVGKLLLAYSQFALGKRANSVIIKANAKNMAGDVLTSIGVLVGFAITHLTGTTYADPIVAALIGLWIIKNAIGIFSDANIELMDGNSNLKSYRVIVEAVDAVDGASNPHRARMRNISGFWDISFDINVNPRFSVAEAHAIAHQVELEIKERLENVYDIMIHLEPYGDDTDEAFGLSESEINDGDVE